MGGDFLDVFPLDGGKVALAVGDISGKGLGAAAYMAQVKFTLRAYLQEFDQPARTLHRLNDFLLRAPALVDEAVNAPFVCLTLAVLDPASGQAAVTVAGAEPMLLIRADGTRERLPASGMPLGIVRQDYTQAAFTLADGDLMVMVTDGITEARQGRGEFLGSEGLERLVREALPLGEVEAIGRSVLAGVRAYAGDDLRDDACMLLARCA